MYYPTAENYFVGGGLSDIGLIQAGVRITQSLDIDPEATAVLHMNPHYHSHKIRTEDITKKLVFDSAEAPDMMGFTYPCTKYSTIGDIHGSRTGDELYLHALRHFALRRPAFFWAENVPGMKKFKLVMEAMTRMPDYYVTVFCPVNASCWLPQDRERLIIIGTLKPFFITPPTPVNNRPRIKDLLEKDPEYDMPDYVLSRINGKYRDKPIVVDPERPGAVAPCCVAHYAKDLGTRLVKDKNAEHGVRPFTIREWARLMGVPDDYKLPAKRSSYRILGNGVPVDMARWIGKQAINYFNQ